MFSVLYFIFTCFIKLVIFLIGIFIALIIGLRLWMEPIKGVCKCTAKLHGRVALVTGGNSGIGLETARNLAKRGARVIIASRDEKRSEEAVLDIIKTTGNANVEYKPLDLSKFSNIRKFAEDFNKSFDRLDILVNNAGCAGLKKCLSEDGVDMVMQINHFGPFLLTNLLLDKLIKSKPSRIVIVSSFGHHVAKFDGEDVAGLKTEGYWYRYANSKLCNILWTKALAKRLPIGITVNALHPGFVETNIFKRLPAFYKNLTLGVVRILFKTPEEGAQTSIHLCVAPELEYASGGFYMDCKPSKTSRLASDEELAERVWKKCLFLTSNS